MQDSEILALYAARDEQAISQTQATYGTYCRTVAGRLLSSDADAEECVNDAFLRAWNAIPPANPQNLRAYLAKIVRRLAFDRYKSQTADKRGGGELPLVLDELSECIPSGNEADHVTEAILLKSCLERFLRELSADKRYIFLRRYWHADTVKAIAAATGKSENDISVTLSRLRTSLKTILEKEGVDL